MRGTSSEAPLRVLPNEPVQLFGCSLPFPSPSLSLPRWTRWSRVFVTDMAWIVNRLVVVGLMVVVAMVAAQGSNTNYVCNPNDIGTITSSGERGALVFAVSF